MAKVTNLQGFGNGGYSWDVTSEGFDHNTGTFTDQTVHYETNAEGDGLWTGGKQIAGTMQFKLSGNKETARRQIKKHFTE